MSLASLREFSRSVFEEWRAIHLADLQFWHWAQAQLVLISLFALIVTLLTVRTMLSRKPGRHRLLVPAVLSSIRWSPVSIVRHGPLLLFLAGLPFLFIALADPFTALVSRDVTYPGRRISVMIDASQSMRTPFTAATLNKRRATDNTFYTAVAAGDSFIRRRIAGKYRDLVALVEFGSEAYVVTPFTTDYDNVLLSISLIGQPEEYSAFPDQGTTIGLAIDESINLFKAFHFLEASGNVMVIFTDGDDSRDQINGRSLDSIMQSAVEARVPVYFVRTHYDRALGKVADDAMWSRAVAKTGGRFYAADNEDAILNAIKDIDAVAVGMIQTRQYSTQRPQFGMFAFVAACCWAAAAMLKLTVPLFQKMP